MDDEKKKTTIRSFVRGLVFLTCLTAFAGVLLGAELDLGVWVVNDQDADPATRFTSIFMLGVLTCYAWMGWLKQDMLWGGDIDLRLHNGQHKR